MTTTTIALDMGSSLIKAIFSGKGGQPVALALRPEVVDVTPDQIRNYLTEYYDDPLRSVYVELDHRTYAIGGFAVDCNGVQYHELSKWSDVLPRVLGVLGLIANHLETHQFNANVCLLMPLSEVLSVGRVAYVKAIQDAARNFKFRGQPISCQLNIQVTVEGGGLYAGHSAYLRSQKQVPEAIDIPVLMGGERNTSLIIYRVGKLNPTLSSSMAGGFYKYADQVLQSLGAQANLSDLIGAIATGKTRIRVAGNEVVDISMPAQYAIQLYSEYLIKLIRAKLPTGEVSVVCGGGALYLAWDKLSQWFREAGIDAHYMGPVLQRDLDTIFSRQRPSDKQHARRFADAIGMYRVLSTAVPKTPVNTP